MGEISFDECLTGGDPDDILLRLLELCKVSVLLIVKQCVAAETR